MRYTTFLPPSSLRYYVRAFWLFESGPAGPEPYVYRALADGCAEIVFHYRGTFTELTGGVPTPQASSMLHAQSSRYRRFETTERFGIFGIYLYPFAAAQLLRTSATDFSNAMPDLHTLFGADGRRWEARIMEAGTDAARVQIASDFLEKRLTDRPEKHRAIHYAIRRLLHSDGNEPVAQLCADACLSHRQFGRKFLEHAGFPPKTLSRIARFGKATARYSGVHTAGALTDIAHSCGYYDQSHFIRDFREFSGYHPTEFFGGSAEGAEWREG